MKIRIGAILICLALGLSVTINAQARRSAQRPMASRPRTVQSQTTTTSLTVSDIIALTRAGIPEDVIASRVRGKKFDATPRELVELKAAGASDNIIRAVAGGSVKVNTMPESTRTESTFKIQPTEIRRSEIAKSTEVGFYLTTSEREYRLPSNTFTGQKVPVGRAVGTMFSLGLVKTEIKATLDGPRAAIRTDNRRPVVIFNAPEGTTADDYFLLRFEKKSDRREIAGARGSIRGISTGFEKSRIVKFVATKISSNKFQITFTQPLEAGEYGFYPKNAIDAEAFKGLKLTSKIHDFGID